MIEIVRTVARFEELEAAWNDLFARAGQPAQVFQTFNWLWSWSHIYLDQEINLAIIAGWRGGRLVMVWPLAICGGLVRRLIWMGEPVSQYGDVLVDEGLRREADLSRGYEAARGLGADLLHLRKVRMDSNAARVLYLHGAAFAAQDAAPYLQLSSAASFAAYETRYGSKVRSSRRRYARRLQGEGAITFEHHGAGPEASALAGQAIGHKKAWAKKNAVIAPTLMDPRFEKFFADAAAGKAHAPDVRVVAVRCDGRVVGVEISLACKGHLFGHVIAHDPAFEKKGVGSVLAEYAICSAHQAGFEVCDLLAPADSYKAEWADGSVAVVDFAAPLSIAGHICAKIWVCGLRPLVKRKVDHAPVWAGRLFEALSGRKQAPQPQGAAVTLPDAEAVSKA